MKKNLLISVIIATKNEEKNIESLLKSLYAQSLPRKFWEVIMVDNSSTDRTRQIAKKMIRHVYNFPKIVDCTNIKNYRGAQVNWAIKKTQSQLIFFPDADMTFDKNLLEEAVKIIAKNHIDALYIPEVVVGKGFIGKVRNFERSFYNETSIDAVRIVRKKLLLEVGGFDVKNFKFGPDDWDLTLALKEKTQKFSSTKSRIHHHEENLTIAEYFAKKWYYASTFDEYVKKWGKDNSDIKKQFNFLYRYFGVFIENGKWRRLISNPHLALGMFFLRFVVGILYIFSSFFNKK